MTRGSRPPSRGPFRAVQLHAGDPYELSDGHAVLCLPTGARCGKANLLGGSVLASDPAVVDASIDVGFSPEPGTLRAPDVSVGVIPDEAGWAPGVPMLALEYADRGQDEDELARKIAELLAHGTKIIWVARLTGIPHVEIHELGRPARVVDRDGLLEAPGILQRPVPVRALLERDAGLDATLDNLLARRGYAGLTAVRAEGREEGRQAGRDEGRQEGRDEGRQEGRLTALVEQLEDRFGALDPSLREKLKAGSADDLRRWTLRVLRVSSANELFDDSGSPTLRLARPPAPGARGGRATACL
jgi:hypothetical protein